MRIIRHFLSKWEILLIMCSNSKGDLFVLSLGDYETTGNTDSSWYLWTQPYL